MRPISRPPSRRRASRPPSRQRVSTRKYSEYKHAKTGKTPFLQPVVNCIVEGGADSEDRVDTTNRWDFDTMCIAVEDTVSLAVNGATCGAVEDTMCFSEKGLRDEISRQIIDNKETAKCYEQLKEALCPLALTTTMQIQQATHSVALKPGWSILKELMADLECFCLMKDYDQKAMHRAGNITKHQNKAIDEPDVDFPVPKSPTKSKNSVSASVKTRQVVNSTNASITSGLSKYSLVAEVPAFVDIGHAFDMGEESAWLQEEASILSDSVASFKSNASLIKLASSPSASMTYIISNVVDAINPDTVKPEAVSVKSVAASTSAFSVKSAADVASVTSAAAKSVTSAAAKSAISASASKRSGRSLVRAAHARALSRRSVNNSNGSLNAGVSM